MLVFSVRMLIHESARHRAAVVRAHRGHEDHEGEPECLNSKP